MRNQTTQTDTRRSADHPDRAEAIQARAYELYLQRGQEPGHELEDWLQAEIDVRAKEQSKTG